MNVLIHGFWGQPMDWNPVLSQLPLGELVWAPDLYESGSLAPNHSLEGWTENFLRQVEAVGEPVNLIGYSMGGRLALNALARAPGLFSRALILSASPFLIGNPDERLRWEEQWSNRFLIEEWTAIEGFWQDQPVFADSEPIPRRHSQALREMLGLSLINWSPRHHMFGESDVRELPASVDWAFGALDQKYVEMAKALQNLPVQGQMKIIPNAGHRLIQDASRFICDWIVRE